MRLPFFLLSFLSIFFTSICQAATHNFANLRYSFAPQFQTIALEHRNSSAAHWQLVHYQFELTLAAILLLSAILGGMLLIDWQLKKHIVQKFLSADNDFKSPLEHYEYPIKKIAIFGMLFMAALLALYVLLLLTYESNVNQTFVKGVATILFIFVLMGGYFFGNIKRSKQLEALVNKLQLHIYDKNIAEANLQHTEQRLLRQNASLAELALIQLKDWHEPEDVFREIAKISAETLNVERVSIWLFSEDQSQLECMNLYVKSKHLYTVAKPLQVKDLPEYFKQVSLQRVLAVDDAMHHPATVEFTHGYLQENNIGALLDGTIWLNNEVIGVICHEHVGAARAWTLDEQSFTGSIADLACLTIETHKRRQAEQAVLKHSEQLERMVEARTRSLQESEQRFASVVKYAPIPILNLNNRGEIIEANPEAESAAGYGQNALRGKNFINLIVAKESRKKALVTAKRAMLGEDFIDVELTLQNAAGEKYQYECSMGAVMFNNERGQTEIVAIARDVSHQKALQASLIQAREAAESADRIKSMFVASMSHELRTPLNSIIGFLGVVLQGMSGELNVKQKDQLGRAYHSAKHLLSLISDVIDISKIEAGFLQTHVEKFELKPLLLEVEQAVSHILSGKPIDFNIDCAANMMVETDRKRLYQVVLNVVSNAVKYTESGAVQLSAILANEQVVITTTDTGIGIGEAGLAKLFAPFERVESHLKIVTLGTGLGLYLTRKILSQLLSGTIEVASELGKGSVFTMTIPSKIVEQNIQLVKSILENPSEKAH